MKFKYGDKVKVIDGFFKDLIGTVADYNSQSNCYYVEMTSTKNNQFTSPSNWESEENLKKFVSGINNGSLGEI